jgi:hypothetical protein
VTPYELLRRTTPVQDATKAELLTVTRRLERVALQAPPPAVAATLQDERYFSDRTRQVYAALAAAGSRARLHARGLQASLAPGVVGVSLDEEDPLVDEWVVVLPGDDPVVFAATDLRVPGCEDDERCFSYGVSRDPSSLAPAGGCSASDGGQAATCDWTSRVIRRSTTNDRNGTVPASATSSVRTTDQPARRARSTVTPRYTM